MAKTMAIKKPKNAVVKPLIANFGFLTTIAKETNPKGGRAGAITIEPIKTGMELVNKATAANTPAVAMNTRYEVVRRACLLTFSIVRSLTNASEEYNNLYCINDYSMLPFFRIFKLKPNF